MVHWYIVDASHGVCQVTEELGSSFLVNGHLLSLYIYIYLYIARGSTDAKKNDWV